jgi:toxin-antitoxin system PIN domain toxin
MIAVDTNILVYAFRKDMEWHERAAQILDDLAFGTDEWSIPSSCLREFVSSVTNPQRFKEPTPLLKARQQVNIWLSWPNLVVLSDNDDHWACLDDAMKSGKTVGKHVYDAHIAALCITHGVKELWTADKGFRRFPGLVVRYLLDDLRVGVLAE